MTDTVRQNKTKNIATSTQLYLPVAEIHDNTVVLKNGGLRAVLEVGSVNVNLKSEEEQTALAYSYQNFLNSLEFPVQIVVQSRKLDISNYLESLKKIGDAHTNELLQNQTYEYAEYIRKLVEFADIMEKKFYLIVPYDPPRAKQTTLFEKFWAAIHPADSVSAFKRRQQEFAELNHTLQQRIDAVTGSLENCSLHTRHLKTTELIKLFYGAYNPLTSQNEKVEAETTNNLTSSVAGSSTPAAAH